MCVELYVTCANTNKNTIRASLFEFRWFAAFVVRFPPGMVKGMLSTAGAAPMEFPFGLAPMYTPEVIAKVQGLIDQGNAGEKTGCWELILDYCTGHEIVWLAVVPPDQCGVHSANRCSFGVGGSESQHLGGKIISTGFSWKRCEGATAIQVPPSPLDKTEIEFNNQLVEISEDLIPSLKMLTQMSIGGGHTNTFLRQVNAGVRCVVPNIGDTDGHLNAELLCVNRPVFKEGLLGLRWRVFHWQYVGVARTR